MLLSIWSLCASSTASTAAAAELVGGREIGDDDGKRVVGTLFVGASVGAFEGLFDGLPVPATVDTEVLVVVATVVATVGSPTMV